METLIEKVDRTALSTSLAPFILPLLLSRSIGWGLGRVTTAAIAVHLLFSRYCGIRGVRTHQKVGGQSCGLIIILAFTA